MSDPYEDVKEGRTIDSVLDDLAHARVELIAARASLVTLHDAAGERDAIAGLLADRSEPGLYAKVEALLAQLAAQAQQIATLDAELAFHRTMAPLVNPQNP